MIKLRVNGVGRETAADAATPILYVLRYRELASRMFPIAMNAMSAIDLQDMLSWRWMVAGGKETPFTEDAYKEMFVSSKGLPRSAIKMADETLRDLFVNQEHEADGERIKQIAASLNLHE